MASCDNRFDGLEWVKGTLSVDPAWSIEPNLELVKQVVKAVLPPQKEFSITFLAEGALNKVYNVFVDGGDELILRLSLPVDPRWKTLSEVATVKWVHCNTHLPVPTILAHAASRDNPACFEWILMSKIPGKPLGDVWKLMQWTAKEQLVRQIAIYFSSVFKKQLRGIGNLYSDPTFEEDMKVQRIVSFQFFWDRHILYPVPRGPFRSSKDWITARLSFDEQDCHSFLAKCAGKEDLDKSDRLAAEVAHDTLRIITRLTHLLPQFFPSNEQDPDGEPSALFHHDLSDQNILVDESGALTGVIDWECVSALPLWKACQFPEFLQPTGPPIDQEPDRSKYADGDGGDQL